MAGKADAQHTCGCCGKVFPLVSLRVDHERECWSMQGWSARA